MINMQAIMQMLPQIKANPAQFLAQRGLNVSGSDPNAIIQQLLNSGRISQNQLNQAYQTLQQFKR